jgi:hypothetical protein
MVETKTNKMAAPTAINANIAIGAKNNKNNKQPRTHLILRE